MLFRSVIHFPLHLIVPTRDSTSLLPRLVHSLKGQTVHDWRVTFIDGSNGAQHQAWLDRLCHEDGRFQWRRQSPEQPGIFAAMNEGFALAAPSDWLLFWGSDDWAAAPDVLERLRGCLESCSQQGAPPDLLVCRGRYYRLEEGSRPRPIRSTAFHWRHSYRRSLLLGSTPPHQATLIGPGARGRLDRYAEGFGLSADLDYFLQLSLQPGLSLCCSDLELVHMGAGGVSGQQTRRRLAEVRRAYRRAYGTLWILPFVLRYLQKISERFGMGASQP